LKLIEGGAVATPLERRGECLFLSWGSDGSEACGEQG
jgi:hypothetical protein